MPDIHDLLETDHAKVKQLMTQIVTAQVGDGERYPGHDKWGQEG